jgi:hypothetical protein
MVHDDYMRNFKGFVFTVDAIFALVVASAATALLLLTLFAPATQLQGPNAESFSIAQSFLQEPIGQVASQVPLASAAVSSWRSSQYTWQQNGNNASQSYSTGGFGPQYPLILFSFNTSTSAAINPSPVIADGLVVFTTNTMLYALNATSGALVFNTVLGSGTFIGSPAIYQQTIYTGTSAGFVNAYTENGGLLWTTSVGSKANFALQIEGGYVEDNMTLLNPYNGTVVATGWKSNSAAYSNGEFVSFYQSPKTNITSYSLYGSKVTELWNSTISTTGTTPYLAYSSGSGNSTYITERTSTPCCAYSQLYAYSSGGASLWNSVAAFGGAEGSSVAIYNNSIFAKSASTSAGPNLLSAYSTTGNSLWNAAIPGNGNYNVTPTVTPSSVYVITSGNTIGDYNRQNGALIWNITLQSSVATSTSVPADLPVAYGNIYAAVGNTLYAIGTCKADPSTSVLQAVATMYLTGDGGCASALLNSSYASGKYAIYINNTYAPSLNVMQFAGGNYLYAPSFAGVIINRQITLSAWVYPTADPPISGFIAGMRNNHDADFYIMQVLDTNTIEAKFRNSTGTLFSTNTLNNTIVPNRWNNIILSYNGTALAIYINGVMTSSVSTGGYMISTITNTSAAFSMGADLLATHRYYRGQLSNVQVYNIGLNASQAEAIYISGIGGGPISANDTAWWPLEGDTNDYSGISYGPGLLVTGNSYGVPESQYYIGNSYAWPVGNPVFTAAQGATPPSLQGSSQISKATVPLSINVNGKYTTYNVGVVVWR